MENIYFLDIESSKTDSLNPKQHTTTTDLVVKKEGKQFKILDCRMEGGITYGIGQYIKANKLAVVRFIQEAMAKYNSNPNKPNHIKMNKLVKVINNWDEEATEDILPDKVLIGLGIDPNTVTRPFS